MVIRRAIEENEFSGIFRKIFKKIIWTFLKMLLTLATSCFEMIKNLTFSPDNSFAISAQEATIKV